MAIKQEIKHRTIQKVYHLHNGIFYPIQLYHTFSVLPYHFPCFYSLNFTKKLQNERKEDFLHIWLLQRIKLYQRRWKITSLNTTEFLDKYVCTNNPHWQSSGIIIFLCKYEIVILDILVGSFLDVLFFLLTLILSELLEKPRGKD